jgi:hypothetical protein
MKEKNLILCGVWNENSNKKDLTDLLLRYNLINTFQSPTRITKSTSTLIDVIIINNKYYMETATVIELGLSDHLAQVLDMPCKNQASESRRVLRRHFGDENIGEFKYLLEKETWQEVFLRDRDKRKIRGYYELSSAPL